MPIKKQYVIDNIPEIPKDQGGLYSIMPYEKLDKHGKAVFKVGYAMSFKNRFEQYHTSYPLGFYMKNLLAEPTEERENFYYKDPKNRNKRALHKKTYYGEIERNIFQDLKDEGAEQLFSTTRVKNGKMRDGVYVGQTEWFYASPKQVDNAFDFAYKIYGGKPYSAHLNNINREADKHRGGNSYSAEIHYKIYS